MTPEEAKAAVKIQDAPKQPRAGRGVLKFDKHLGNEKKNNIIVVMKIILFSINTPEHHEKQQHLQKLLSNDSTE